MCVHVWSKTVGAVSRKDCNRMQNPKCWAVTWRSSVHVRACTLKVELPSAISMHVPAFVNGMDVCCRL